MNNEYDYQSFKKMNCETFIDYLLTLSSNELSVLAVGIGFLLSTNTNINQQNSLGNFFELIGQLLLTISAQEINLQPTYPSRIQLQQQINELKLEIARLRQSIL